MPTKYYSKEPIYCPVCKELLGTRYHDDLFSSHCSECKATFTYYPYNPTPKAMLDHTKDSRCNCGGCGR